jgi:hypothetical protein
VLREPKCRERQTCIDGRWWVDPMGLHISLLGQDGAVPVKSGAK